MHGPWPATFTGTGADDYLLGVYRADEDNRVAAGGAVAESPAGAAGARRFPGRRWAPSITGSCAGELLDSILQDTLRKAGALKVQAALSLGRLALYRDALRTAQSNCVREALRHFPMDMVLRRFAEIWLATGPRRTSKPCARQAASSICR